MAFEIEIIEGHNPTSYFWFRPVIVKLIQEEDGSYFVLQTAITRITIKPR